MNDRKTKMDSRIEEIVSQIKILEDEFMQELSPKDTDFF